MRRLVPLLLPLLVLLAGTALRQWDPTMLRELRYRAFDLFQRLEPRDYDPSLPVRIVAIDEESLRQEGQWPWPRTKLAELLDRLGAMGAASVSFDVMFAEADRSSPTSLIELVPQGPGRQALELALASGALVDSDKRLAEALAATASVLAVAPTADPDAESPGAAAPEPKVGFSIKGESPLPYIHRFPFMVAPLPLLAEAAGGLGSIAIVKDGDGTLRRIALIVAVGDRLFPSLTLEALRVALGGGILVQVSGNIDVAGSGGLTGVQALKVGPARSGIVVETEPAAELWLYDSGHQAQRFVSASAVLDGSVDPALIEGNLVLVGATAAALFDDVATPTSGAMPGVEVHAQVLEQMLTGSYLSRPAWAGRLEVYAVLGVGLLVLLCFALKRLGPTWAAVLGFACVLVAIGGAWYAFVVERFLLDPLTPSVVGLLVYGTAAVTSYLDSERQRRQVRTAFGQYVSPAVVAKIAANPKQVVLGGESRDLTLLFCDIQGFTTFSEQLDPQTLTRLINRFLTEMSSAVLNGGGTIDKYMGDCIMAFWNAPLDLPDHADRSLAAVLDMRRRLARLNETLAAEHTSAPGAAPAALRVGIGLNSGPCSVGNMGSDQRLAYTAIGDAVNLASRLEGLTRLYGVDCLVSESTAEAARSHCLMAVDRLRVKGKSNAVAVHVLLGPAADAEQWQPHQAAVADYLAAFRAGDWGAAAAALEVLAPLLAGTPLAGLEARYEQRLAAVSGAPAPAGWDGTFSATEK